MTDDLTADEPRRRSILKAAGAGGLLLGGGGSAAAVLSGGGSAGDDAGGTTIRAEGPERYNVLCASEKGAAAATEIAKTVHGRIGPLDAVTIEAEPAGLQELQENDAVLTIEADRAMRLGVPGQAAETERRSGSQEIPWGVERIGAPSAHTAGATGKGADVAVLDSGIDPDHEDLAANVGESTAFVDCEGDCGAPYDDDRTTGHGTHVAGTIAAVDNRVGVLGVAPDATLHAVKVIDRGGAARFSDIAAGLSWAAERGYDVANLSLGGEYSRTLEAAVRYAHDRDLLMVASAQNVGGPVQYPASDERVIAVSATTREDELAYFSDRGPEVELAAPGVDILSTFPEDNYLPLSGTSMAAPHVGGTAALLRAGGLSAAETRRVLVETADDIGLPPEKQGEGLVDAAAAVRESGEKRRERDKKKRKRREKNRKRDERHCECGENKRERGGKDEKPRRKDHSENCG